MKLGPDGPNSLEVRDVSGQPACQRLVNLFEDVIDECGFEFEGQSGTHRAVSKYFAFERESNLAGGAWVILHSDAGFAFETWDTWRDVVETTASDAELALVCLAREYRGLVDVTHPLLTCMSFLYAQGVRRILSELSPSTVRVFRRIGLHFALAHPLSLKRENGTDTMLCEARLAQFLEVHRLL